MSGPAGRRPDAWLVVAVGIIEGSALGVVFQAANLLLGPVLIGLAVGWLIVGLAVIGFVAHRAGARHAFEQTSLIRASAWTLVIAIVGGWFWMLQGAHGTSALVTSLVALAAAAPTLGVGLRLRRR